MRLPDTPSRLAEMFEIRVWSDLVAAAPPSLAKATGLELDVIAGAVCVVAPGIPSREFNRCVGLGVGRPATPSEVEAVLAFYRSRGAYTAWIQLMDGALPDALPHWLAERGATPDQSGWILFDRGTEPIDVRPSALEFVEIDASDAARASEAFCIGYGLPPPFAPWIASLVGRPGWRAYAAFENRALVATALLYLEGERALLAGAATLSEARGRGAQSGLLSLRVKEAAATGATIIQSHTWLPQPGKTNPSLDNMRRSGLRELHRRRNIVVGTVPP